MNTGMLFLVYSIYNLLMGAVFIFMPAQAMQGAGFTANGELVATHQIWGSALIGIALIGFSLRSAAASGTVRAFAFTGFIAVLVTLYHFMQGFAGPGMYVNVVVQAAFGVGFFLKSRS
jgi:hypothetical protein